ncbi:hypothetical protein Taro_037574 [Colocasia esculenta]|uniref:Uncharacterized protein n=1 Tax=Colocasia esculenta TaxID=4460 RepID=A0A843WQ41_COLES|nr:hypothetical protein [Colocasia esculenta]
MGAFVHADLGLLNFWLLTVSVIMDDEIECEVSGTKRRASDYSASPHPPTTGNNGTSGPLVYVRRKLEETGKVHTCGDLNVATPLKARKFSDTEKKGFSQQPDQIESRVSCSQAFSPLSAAALTASSCGIPVPSTGVPTNVFMPMEPSSSIPSGTPVQSNSPSSNKVHWKERFLRLQIFLNSCDQSSQDEYIQIGRSKHAVELEKRAIHLLLEEGKELHRMKLLNVLGKVSP